MSKFVARTITTVKVTLTANGREPFEAELKNEQEVSSAVELYAKLSNVPTEKVQVSTEEIKCTYKMPLDFFIANSFIAKSDVAETEGVNNND